MTSVVDLCAAPGGWSILSTSIIKERHKGNTSALNMNVVAVDVVPIHALEGVKTIVGDITHPTTANQIITAVNGQSDLVLFDGAPEVTGLVENDQWQQHVLVEAGAQLCIHILRPGGTYVAKVFRGSATETLLHNLSVLFHQVLVTKPQASRNSSLEVFVMCRGLKHLPVLRAIPLDTAFALGLAACVQYQLQADAQTGLIADKSGLERDVHDTTPRSSSNLIDTVSQTCPTFIDDVTACVCAACSGYAPPLASAKVTDPVALQRAIRAAYGGLSPCTALQAAYASEASHASADHAVSRECQVLRPRYYPFYLCSDRYDSDMSYAIEQSLPYDVFDYLRVSRDAASHSEAS